MVASDERGPTHLHAKPLNALQQLAPRDEGRQEQVAQRSVLEQQRPQRVAINGDVSQRLRNDRRHENGLAGQQVELSEETRRAVTNDLVTRLVDDGHLALDDRDEGVPPIADPVQHVADLRRALVAELGKRRQLRRGQPRTNGTRHGTSLVAPEPTPGRGKGGDDGHNAGGRLGRQLVPAQAAQTLRRVSSVAPRIFTSTNTTLPHVRQRATAPGARV